jgi:hypothetical protein
MDMQQLVPLTLALGKVTLAAGTTTTLTNTGTTTYAIKGKAYTKTAMTNAASPTTDYATGSAFLPLTINKGTVFMVGFDSGGAVRAIQGTSTDLDGAAVATAKFLRAPQFGGFGPAGSGSTNNDFCPVGYIIVKAGSDYAGTGWTFGSSNWAGITGIATTFVDVIGWPDRPQVS